jgi:hypothetical protein
VIAHVTLLWIEHESLLQDSATAAGQARAEVDGDRRVLRRLPQVSNVAVPFWRAVHLYQRSFFGLEQPGLA